MRLPWCLPLAAAAALLAVGPAQAGPAASGPAASTTAAAADPCAQASSNLEMRSCLAERVVQIDRQLITALEAVQRQALAEPSREFQRGWTQLLDSQAGGTDPAGQLQRFQAERRRLCLYSQSISFQGSGFGGFVSSCEWALSDTLLKQLRGE